MEKLYYVPLIHKTCGTEICVLLNKEEMDQKKTDRVLVGCMECSKFYEVNEENFFFYPERSLETSFHRSFDDKKREEISKFWEPGAVEFGRSTGDYAPQMYRINCEEKGPSWEQYLLKNDQLYTIEQITERYRILNMMGDYILCCSKTDEDDLVSFTNLHNGHYMKMESQTFSNGGAL